VAIVHRTTDTRSSGRTDLRMSGAFRCVEEQQERGWSDRTGSGLL
jgi:hypothetical protein